MEFKFIVKTIIILLSVCLTSIFGAPRPIFRLFGSDYGQSERAEPYRGRSYNDIARVINPSPYAFPRSSPYPAQPFWTFG